jgi:hypothetical protein
MIKFKLTFKPIDIPYSLCGETKLSTVEISIDSKIADASGSTTFRGEYADSVARWLKTESGYQGHLVGELASPINVAIAISRATWLTFEIVTGFEILQVPVPPVPDVCYS